jgi:hypothetical protein
MQFTKYWPFAQFLSKRPRRTRKTTAPVESQTEPAGERKGSFLAEQAGPRIIQIAPPLSLQPLGL